jgi:hypothetical protein
MLHHPRLTLGGEIKMAKTQGFFWASRRNRSGFALAVAALAGVAPQVMAQALNHENGLGEVKLAEKCGEIATQVAELLLENEKTAQKTKEFGAPEQASLDAARGNYGKPVLTLKGQYRLADFVRKSPGTFS